MAFDLVIQHFAERVGIERNLEHRPAQPLDRLRLGKSGKPAEAEACGSRERKHARTFEKVPTIVIEFHDVIISVPLQWIAVVYLHRSSSAVPVSAAEHCRGGQLA